MNYLTTDQIREHYLRFFESKGHKRVASDSLVPSDDPTLLFTGAGMNQFKKQFMGQITGFTKATSSQKCLRTGDLEKVGKTACHHTFFEMLGNFSFGDYFKKEAILWAWELLTKEFHIPKESLFVSVYEEDEEAFTIWHKEVGLPKEKIARLGQETNFWPANAPKEGPNGPCGPCSEIFFDLGPAYGCGKSSCGVDCECRRYVEIWNLVFTQFERVGQDELVPLPAKNIDTGMGLERIASVLQKVPTNFQIDIFVPLTQSIAKLLGLKYGKNKEDDSAIHAIADHIRAVTFSIADGVIPSNDERGYVIRKLIRRAVWYGKRYKTQELFLHTLVPIVAQVMQHAYPELAQRKENIAHIVQAEEKRFSLTLEEGQRLLEKEIQVIRKTQTKVLAGDIIFKLYDTCGFPVDLTRDIAEKEGIRLDEKGFESLMQEQRNRARAESQIADAIFVKKDNPFCGMKSVFLGYVQQAAAGKIIAMAQGNKKIDQAREGMRCEIVLDKTPFYAASGGQVADKGELIGKQGKALVHDVMVNDDAMVLSIEVKQGSFSVSEEVTSQIDTLWREDIMRNHTATHLLHAVLRNVLGAHVHQAGSLVEPQRLRFDFSHFEAIQDEVLRKIEDQVNAYIMQDMPVICEEMTLEDAKKTGAQALFGEKYKDAVRVLTIGQVSKELCGGTHVARTGQIGFCKIVSETSIASGVRRIEAVTGRAASVYVREQERILDSLGKVLKVAPTHFFAQVQNLMEKIKDMEKQIKGLKNQSLAGNLDAIIASGKTVGMVKIISAYFDDVDQDFLRKTIDTLKTKVSSGIFILGTHDRDKAVVICGVTNDLVARGIEAPGLLQQAASLVGGKGGGRKDMAFAGGKEIAKIREALQEAEKTALARLGQ